MPEWTAVRRPDERVLGWESGACLAQPGPHFLLQQGEPGRARNLPADTDMVLVCIGRIDLEYDLRRIRLSPSAIIVSEKARKMVLQDIRGTVRVPA